jgi:hypothetical protein
LRAGGDDRIVAGYADAGLDGDLLSQFCQRRPQAVDDCPAAISSGKQLHGVQLQQSLYLRQICEGVGSELQRKKDSMQWTASGW